MTKKTKFTLEEVFTPSQPASYTFVERKSVDSRLDRALRTPGKQIIVYGYSGVGKTTLLTNKFKSQNISTIITRCVSGMTLADIVKDAFNQLEVFFVSQADKLEGNKIGGDISASYFGIKASISAEVRDDNKLTIKRAVELPITPQTLAKYIGESNNCWVIEDFHKIKSDDKILLAQIMKVFMDSSVDYPKLKIIAIGAVNTAREVVQFDPEMKNRISEIEVPLMSNDNLASIIEVGEKLLNIVIPSNVSNKIIAYSSGLPAVTHQLGLLVCELNNVLKTHVSPKALEIKINTFDAALDEFLAENSDTYKAIYESAIKVVHKRKSENPKDILKAILASNKENVTVSDIKETLQLQDRNYKGNNLKKYVDELTLPTRSEILRLNKNSNSYYFANPFIKAYCQCTLRSGVVNPATLLKEFRITLNRELEIARQAFIRDFEE
ncbi:ATP-binding protein [Maribacter hydrothermalis]|uniref:AAA ATPase domain-containing protein n=1 Tax=Maribacter hydrothermalis TaxID=1836467 RepID=A0A1B7YZ23_9FLAO|nr:ATP-binding protein [Maribacter hydrothermalis]APQ16176.1 hypothetical protein BTR34_01905 [Maribacter hydrothermalis]OBR35646.1 hypothetical protein A9200_10610 [Maribacter hydrothermalis]